MDQAKVLSKRYLADMYRPTVSLHSTFYRPDYCQCATLYTDCTSLDSVSPAGRYPSRSAIPSASKWLPPSPLCVYLLDASNRLISVWSVRCRGGAANAILRVGVPGKSPLHVTACLRFSKIRQQTMLCTARVVEAVTSPYSGCAEKRWVLGSRPQDHESLTYWCKGEDEDRKNTQN